MKVRGNFFNVAPRSESRGRTSCSVNPAGPVRITDYGLLITDYSSPARSSQTRAQSRPVKASQDWARIKFFMCHILVKPAKGPPNRTEGRLISDSFDNHSPDCSPQPKHGTARSGLRANSCDSCQAGQVLRPFALFRGQSLIH